MGHRLQQFLPFGWIVDLGVFLRQIEVIPADDAILDEPFAGCGHLLVFLLRLQEFAWIADRDRAREGMDMLDAAEHLFNGHAQSRLVDHSQNEPPTRRRFLAATGYRATPGCPASAVPRPRWSSGGCGDCCGPREWPPGGNTPGPRLLS